MQHAKFASSNQTRARNGRTGSPVPDLVALIGHLQAASRGLEIAIAEATESGSQDSADTIFELDDVTPCYIEMRAALDACRASLSAALQLLQHQKDGDLAGTRSDLPVD